MIDNIPQKEMYKVCSMFVKVKGQKTMYVHKVKKMGTKVHKLKPRAVNVVCTVCYRLPQAIPHSYRFITYTQYIDYMHV